MDLNFQHIYNMKYAPKIGKEQGEAKHKKIPKDFPRNRVYTS